MDAVDRLALFPERGRVVPELPHAGLRELIVGSYRVVYRVQEAEGVEIVTVFHGARLLRLEGSVPEGRGA
jgi:plasmid stabilization system protein ParE